MLNNISRLFPGNFAMVHTLRPLVLLLSFLMIPAAMASEERVSTISVSGTGSVNVAPDLALISFGVVREAKTAREALTANNRAMSEVLQAMKDMGIADKDLQTSNFNISPRYHYPERNSDNSQPQPVITGYVVSNELAVRVRDLSKTGEILDLVVTLGVNSGGNIRFMNDKPEAFLEKARVAAVKNALSKANILATTAGVGLGRILEISENANQPRPVPMAHTRMAAQEDAGSVPVASGENSYSVHVQISWEISQ